MCSCSTCAHAPAPRRAQKPLRLACPCVSRRMQALPVEQPPVRMGSIKANVHRLWSFYTDSMYRGGDLPVLAAREALQNSKDAIAAAIRARQIRAGQGRFEVRWDQATHTLTFEDNGIGMDADTIDGKFLSLGDSGKADAQDSDEAAGGFGVAKAVILGVSSTFRWSLHTRAFLAQADGWKNGIPITAAPPRQGTVLDLFDVDPDFDLRWDRAARAWTPILDRLRAMLALNDLPDIELRLNGEVVRPAFRRTHGTYVRLDGEAAWGRGVHGTAKAYRRQAGPTQGQGAYYVRLNGLFQFAAPARGRVLPADVVIDLKTAIRPGAPGYPLPTSRDSLINDAEHAFRALTDEVERENESIGRSEEYERVDPEGDDLDSAGQAAAIEVEDALAEAFGSEEVQDAIKGARGGLADYLKELRSRRRTVAPAGSTAGAGSPPERGAGEAAPPSLPRGIEDTLAGPADDFGPTEVIRSFLVSSQGLQASELAAAERVIQRIERETATPQDELLLRNILQLTVDGAMAPGGGGLLHLARVPEVLRAFEDIGEMGLVSARSLPRNPFGKAGGLLISKVNYDKRKASAFKRKGVGKWLPYLILWDATLRLIANEAGIRRSFKPGFVLDDTVLGMMEPRESGDLVHIHPDRFAEAAKAHRDRPIALAAWVHGIAVHELVHLDARTVHSFGHDERFVVAREALGSRTGHLLPVIAALAIQLLRLPTKPDEALAASRNEVAFLRRRLDAQSRLDNLHAKVRKAATKAGLEPHDVDAFVCRQRPALLKALERAHR